MLALAKIYIRDTTTYAYIDWIIILHRQPRQNTQH